jgi:hypothetical protein
MRHAVMKMGAAASCVLSLSAACGPIEGGREGQEEEDVDQAEQAVSGLLLQQRCDTIKSSALARGITNALVIAGVGYHETGSLNQCWSEAQWACQGPASPDCGGGPVIAGSGDGACSLNAGGLGMFQFDAGNHQQTLNTYGSGILTVSGNITAAVTFIINKVWISTTTPFFPNQAAEIAWINSAVPGTQAYEVWLTTMATYYNGCGAGCANHASVRAAYDSGTRALLNTFGQSYWYGGSPPPPPSGACSCAGGSDHRGVSIPASSTYCGFRICGGDHHNYECTTSGWSFVSASSCGFGSCRCSGGSDDQGRAIDPNATECGYRVCGGDHQFYDCKSAGWTGTSQACSSTQ